MQIIGTSFRKTNLIEHTYSSWLLDLNFHTKVLIGLFEPYPRIKAGLKFKNQNILETCFTFLHMVERLY